MTALTLRFLRNVVFEDQSLSPAAKPRAQCRVARDIVAGRSRLLRGTHGDVVDLARINTGAFYRRANDVTNKRR